MKITPDIVDKFLTIEPAENSHTWSLGTITAIWKDVADQLFTNDYPAEAERLYKAIFDLMSSDSWKSIIAEPGDEDSDENLILPIKAGFNLATLQIRRGIEIQEVLTVFLEKLTV